MLSKLGILYAALGSVFWTHGAGSEAWKQAGCGTSECRSRRGGASVSASGCAATHGAEGPVACFIDGRNYECVCVCVKFWGELCWCRRAWIAYCTSAVTEQCESWGGHGSFGQKHPGSGWGSPGYHLSVHFYVFRQGAVTSQQLFLCFEISNKGESNI